MKRTLVLAALLCISCASSKFSEPQPYSLQMAENDCAAENSPFELLSGCLQFKMQQYRPEWTISSDADILQVYFSWLTAAGDRVSRGEMSEATGRTQANELKSRLETIQIQRQTAVRQQALMNALAGYAILDSANPKPGPTITCRTTPTGLGTSTTTCQ